MHEQYYLEGKKQLETKELKWKLKILLEIALILYQSLSPRYIKFFHLKNWDKKNMELSILEPLMW